MLSAEETRLLDLFIGHKGYSQGGLVTGFQYMIPDNNTSLSGYLFLPNLNNPLAGSNKPRFTPKYDQI